MRIVFFAAPDYEQSELFRYLFAQVAGRFEDYAIVVARRPKSKENSMVRAWKRLKKKKSLLGITGTLEFLSSLPLYGYVMRYHRHEVNRLLARLPRPSTAIDPSRVFEVSTVNGPHAVSKIESLSPDIVIQSGAGILKPQIFTIAKLGTLNLHHGIAPAIRGMNSILWGLWEKKAEWIGSTVHLIDSGIDTGPVLAHAPVAQTYSGEGFPSLYVRATEAGVKSLLQVIGELRSGVATPVALPRAASVYRSTLSGWKLTLLECRLWAERGFRHSKPSLKPLQPCG